MIASWRSRVATFIVLTLTQFPHSAIADEVTAQAILDKIAKDIDALFDYNKQSSDKYALKKKSKALAACIEWDDLIYRDGKLTSALPFFDVASPVRWYQVASGRTSIKEATSSALEKCRPHELVCKCEIFSQDDSIVAQVPADVLQRLAEAKKSEEKFIVVLDDIESRITKNQKTIPFSDFELGPGKDLSVWPIGCPYSYDCSCHKRFRADVIPMPAGKGIEDRLNRIRSMGFYDCREMKSLPPGDLIVPYSRVVCHFVAAKRGTQKLVGLVSPGAGSKTYDEVLYEAAVPVNSSYEPSDIPLEGRRVVYARSGDKEYLGIQRETAWDGNLCGVGYTFQGEAFNLEKCRNTAECGKKATAALGKSIRSRLTAPPFDAEPMPATPIELAFQRHRKPSLILKSPFWEKNDYNLSWWQANGHTSSGFPDQEEFRGTTDRGDKIFVKLTSVILVSIGDKPKYRDPEPVQQDRYDELFRNTYRSALEESCKSLKGNFAGDICTLSDTAY